MDGMRAFDEDHALDRSGDVDAHAESAPPPAIGTDERRMHVRAYNHWASLLNGRAYPSIEDLEPAALEDFGPHSVLLDFTGGADACAIAWLGKNLREECGLDPSASLADIPSRSLLSRLTDHYLQIIANRAPIGFEAEFVNTRGVGTMYRGILMPYSSDGETIDFIYGVINWKEVADPATTARLHREVEQSLAEGPPQPEEPPVVWADVEEDVAEEVVEVAEDEGAEVEIALPDEAGLADFLSAARDGADAVKTADSRSRAALYRALGLAYDFALVAEARAEDYAELLDDSGLKRQERAPMTPIVKLVFGIDYDKARLTEFAAALAFGRRTGVAAGALREVLEQTRGGLKALVKAERDARAHATRRADNRAETARERLRAAEPRAIVQISGGEEFVVLIARRVSGEAVAVLGEVPDAALVERAILKAAA